MAASPAENADRRDFVVWVLGVSEKAEITSSVVPMASHVLRACRVAPVVDALHSGVPVTEAFGESGVLAQQSFLFRELPPKPRYSETYLAMCVFSMTVLPAMAARSS